MISNTYVLASYANTLLLMNANHACFIYLAMVAVPHLASLQQEKVNGSMSQWVNGSTGSRVSPQY